MLKKGDILIPAENRYSYCLVVDYVLSDHEWSTSGYLYVYCDRIDINEKRQPVWQNVSKGHIRYMKRTSDGRYKEKPDAYGYEQKFYLHNPEQIDLFLE